MKKPLIKNYTTEIPAQKTISEIQQLLAENGARGIASEYDADGRITDVFFKIYLNDKEWTEMEAERNDRSRHEY